jgi:hypothetical protein
VRDWVALNVGVREHVDVLENVGVRDCVALSVGVREYVGVREIDRLMEGVSDGVTL